MLRRLRILSVDVVAGACICTTSIACVLGVELPLSALLSLGLAVWSIYTGDHLLDAICIPHRASSHRHEFHQRHFWALSIALMTSCFAGLILAFIMPLATLLGGIVLASSIVLSYILRLLRPGCYRLLKEPATAAFFSLGLFVGPISLLNHVTADVVWLFCQFTLIALINLLIFSQFEHQSDLIDGQSSMATTLGLRNNRMLTILIFLVFMAITLARLFSTAVNSSSTATQLILLLMGSVLGLLILRQQSFRSAEQYRIIGDGVFLLPLLVIV